MRAVRLIAIWYAVWTIAPTPIMLISYLVT